MQLLSHGAGGHFTLLEDHTCDQHMMIPNKCVAILSKHKDEVWQTKFSVDGSMLATIGKDNLLYIWTITKTLTTYRIKCTHEIRGHTKQVNCMNWSPDGKLIVTASHDFTAKIWDTKTGALTLEIKR